jgi:hypothetical protein
MSGSTFWDADQRASGSQFGSQVLGRVNRDVRPAFGNRALDFAREQALATDGGEWASISISGGTDDVHVDDELWVKPFQEAFDDLSLGKSEARASGCNRYLGRDTHRRTLTIQRFVIQIK